MPHYPRRTHSQIVDTIHAVLVNAFQESVTDIGVIVDAGERRTVTLLYGFEVERVAVQIRSASGLNFKSKTRCPLTYAVDPESQRGQLLDPLLNPPS